MGRRRAVARARLAAGILLAGTLAAACGASSADAPVGTSGSSRQTTSTTTTTTTTLPRPVRVRGTGITGDGATGTGRPGPTASYGAVERVLVRPLADGASAPASPTTTLPVPAGSVQIAFHRIGSGPDLLLVPGEHATMSSWDPNFVEALAQHYTVVVFDLPSTGYSAPDPAARSVAGLADVTAGLVVALGLGQPTVLGWGLGGEIALSLAERHPGLVGRLVLADATAGGPKAPRPAPAVAKLLASPSTTTTEIVGLEMATEAGRAALLSALSAYAPDDLTTAGVDEEASVLEKSYRDPSIVAGLRSIIAPALVITGGRDEVVPPSSSAVLRAGLAHVRSLRLAKAGYGAIFEDEPKVVAAIEAFTG